MRSSVTLDNWQGFGDGGSAHLSRSARKVANLLAIAGITLNGQQPWDLRVHDARFFRRVLAMGNLGAGEAYMDGWWDVDALDEFFARIERAELYKQFGFLWSFLLAVKGRMLNLQTQRRGKRVAEWHYNLGNDLYQAMLGRYMQYSCGYWSGAKTIDQAQKNKLHLICRKLGLRPGMRLLDIGGGFGTLARIAAKEYGCEVVGYNISHEQVVYARELCRGLSVRIEEKDYRAAIAEQKVDRIVSVGFFEHVGHKNYDVFLQLARACLKDKGLFLLHTIGGNQARKSTDAWINKYIFPGGVIPSAAQLSSALEASWVVEDWHNFGPDYDRTLMAWWRNFEHRWPELRPRYGDRFYRMWKYYLLSSAGAFRARTLQLWQIVLSKGDIASYTPVR